MKLNELTPVFVETIPEKLEHRILYVSEEFEVSIHLCCCGCGNQTVLPFAGVEWWKYTKEEGNLITFNPSIGNFSFPCKSHYYIVKNKIKWL